MQTRWKKISEIEIEKLTYDLLTCIRASVRPIFIANSSLKERKKKEINLQG